MTLRITSPASIARKASFTPSSLMVFDLHHRHLVDRHGLGERAEAGHAEVRVAVRPGPAHLHRYLGLELAQLGLLAEAVPARATRGHEGRDDAVALLHARHLGARLDDAAGALVPEHHAGRDGHVAAHDRQVRVADPARPDLDDD